VNWLRHFDYRYMQTHAATPDEIANVAALMMGADGAFITGSDFLVDGGTTSVHWFG
jgi:hypothetical protein